jgi:hypothetical protein
MFGIGFPELIVIMAVAGPYGCRAKMAATTTGTTAGASKRTRARLVVTNDRGALVELTDEVKEELAPGPDQFVRRS